MIWIDVVMIAVAFVTGGLVGKFVIPQRIRNTFLKKEIAKKEERLDRLTEKLDNTSKD